MIDSVLKHFVYVTFVTLITLCSCKEQVVESNKVQGLSEIQFGSQIWSGENLSITMFQNGDTIPYISDPVEWEKAGREGKPAWCYYEGGVSLAGLRGKLYNWHAVNDSRLLAPKGWHIPSLEEWRILFQTLGGAEQAGNKLKTVDFNRGLCILPLQKGFNAQPSGGRFNFGEYSGGEEYANWWTKTRYGSGDAFAVNIFRNSEAASEFTFYTRFGFSIRCVKD
jgi:uncharacterized protein (TIGR02145 family)